MEIKTEIELKDNLVTKITFTDKNENVCEATVNDDGDTYRYTSKLEMLDGNIPKESGDPTMTLADCILAAYVHLGVIPPHNFDSVPSPNQH